MYSIDAKIKLEYSPETIEYDEGFDFEVLEYSLECDFKNCSLGAGENFLCERCDFESIIRDCGVDSFIEKKSLPKENCILNVAFKVKYISYLDGEGDVEVKSKILGFEKL